MCCHMATGRSYHIQALLRQEIHTAKAASALPEPVAAPPVELTLKTLATWVIAIAVQLFHELRRNHPRQGRSAEKSKL